jgi:hypothetical protein
VPDTSISMMSEAAHVGDAAGSSSGSGVTVTGNRPGVDDAAADGSLASRQRRRQLNTWFALTSYCRATTETDAPGTSVAATISRFSASGQRLLRRRSPLVPILGFVDTSPPALTHQKRVADSIIRAAATRRCSPEGDVLSSSAMAASFLSSG